MSKKFYITTAIDYVNSPPHIGTAYEKIGADVLARWHRLLGDKVHFQMGNDEHSVNVHKAALASGKSPKDYCNEMRRQFEKSWEALDISYDGFIQTTDPRHESGVQKLLSLIMNKGDIYKKLYEGWYCESCEAFLTEKDLVDGLCPNHKSKPKWLYEENYFFALSKYRDRLLSHIKKHPEFILPDIRRNEILSLLKEGLQDVSVSRSSFNWGIAVPDDANHVVYVWFDALVNYITAIGYGWDEGMFKKWWPADVHVIGKDITRFHCVIWPAMLMSAGIELPKSVFGHGFVTLGGEKMSKTLGNIVTPDDVVARVGSDPLRYYMMREGSFGRDSDFTWEHFLARYNGDLANGIGNLVSRTVGMAAKYQGGVIRPVKRPSAASSLGRAVKSVPDKVVRALDHTNGEVEFHNALAAIWEVISLADRHINDNKPWEMAKTGKSAEINEVLWEIASAIRVVTILLSPFMPRTASRIWSMMGFESLGALEKHSFDQAKKGVLDRAISVNTGQGIFPRIEEEKKMEQKESAELIEISEFARVDLRTARIMEAEKIEGADKLLKLKVVMGSEERQIVAGIAKHYTPEELIGKSVVIVANLKPVTLRGVQSNGMLLAASDKDTVAILSPVKEVEPGSRVK